MTAHVWLSRFWPLSRLFLRTVIAHAKDGRDEKQPLIVGNSHIQNIPSMTGYQLFKKPDSLQLIIYRKALLFRNYTCYTLLFSKHWHKMKAKNATCEKVFLALCSWKVLNQGKMNCLSSTQPSCCGRSVSAAQRSATVLVLTSCGGQASTWRALGKSHLLTRMSPSILRFQRDPFRQVQLPTYSSLTATCVTGWQKLWNPLVPSVKMDTFSETVSLHSPITQNWNIKLKLTICFFGFQYVIYLQEVQ